MHLFSQVWSKCHVCIIIFPYTKITSPNLEITRLEAGTNCVEFIRYTYSPLGPTPKFPNRPMIQSGEWWQRRPKRSAPEIANIGAFHNFMHFFRVSSRSTKLGKKSWDNKQKLESVNSCQFYRMLKNISQK